jgi:Trypsin-like peptidase domain
VLYQWSMGLMVPSHATASAHISTLRGIDRQRINAAAEFYGEGYMIDRNADIFQLWPYQPYAFFLVLDGFKLSCIAIRGEQPPPGRSRPNVDIHGNCVAAHLRLYRHQQPCRFECRNHHANRPDRQGVYCLAGSRTKLDTRVFTIGFPAEEKSGQGPKQSQGRICGLNGTGTDDAIYRTSVSVRHGNSGGPLMNLTGEVVGVVRSMLAYRDPAS